MSTNKQIGNKVRFELLTPEDIEFIQIINDNVTSSNSLPFDVPMDQVLRILIRSLKWFWHWYPDATQEGTLYVPLSEIREKASSSRAGQIDIKLPEGIEGIFNLNEVGGITSNGIAKSLRVPLLNSYQQSYSSYGGLGGSATSGVGDGFRSTYGSGFNSLNDVVLQMYEQSQYETLFKRGYRFSFNKNSQILRLMTGSINNGFVCQIFERLEPQIMYGDQMFEDYVTAKVEEALGKIVMAFDFQLPGNVKINYDEIKANGRDRAKEIEDDIKGMNNSDLILTI